MRTRIAWAALTLAVVAGTSLVAVACNTDTITPARPPGTFTPAPGTPPQSLEELHAWMGEYHNGALAYGLVKMNQSKVRSRFDKCRTGLAALKEFQKSYTKSGGVAITHDFTLTDGMCEEALETGGSVVRSLELNPTDIRLRLDMSPTGSAYLDQILGAIDQANSVGELSSLVSRIRNSAAGALDPLEASAVAGAGSIAVGSAEYWEVNEGSWRGNDEAQYSVSTAGSIFNPALKPPASVVYSLSPRAKKILKADAAAAVGVLVAQWWMGEFALEAAAIKGAAASLIAGVWAT